MSDHCEPDHPRLREALREARSPSEYTSKVEALFVSSDTLRESLTLEVSELNAEIVLLQQAQQGPTRAQVEALPGFTAGCFGFGEVESRGADTFVRRSDVIALYDNAGKEPSRGE